MLKVRTLILMLQELLDFKLPRREEVFLASEVEPTLLKYSSKLKMVKLASRSSNLNKHWLQSKGLILAKLTLTIRAEETSEEKRWCSDMVSSFFSKLETRKITSCQTLSFTPDTHLWRPALLLPVSVTSKRNSEWTSHNFCQHSRRLIQTTLSLWSRASSATWAQTQSTTS